MTMTPTDRPQNPRECKYLTEGKCTKGPHIIRNHIISVWCIGPHCPDYEPKEKKDGN